MAIPLTGTGGLFTRVGQIGGFLNHVNSFRGTANLSAAGIESVATAVDTIQAQFVSTNQQLIDSLYSQRDSYRLVHASIGTYLQTLSQSTVIKMADDDVKLLNRTLVASVTELIAQMKSASQSVPRPTVTGTVTMAGGNTGNGILTVSVIGADGVQLDYPFGENIDAKVVNDAQSGGTAGQETWSLTGDGVQTDQLSWDWPAGSGANLILTGIDPAIDASTQLLTNGDFETFTSNVPNNWTIQTGTAGTTIFAAGSGDAYKGSDALKYTGNGTELTSLFQQFGISTGTVATLQPRTVYAVNAWMKVSSVPAAGQLDIELVDGSNNVVNDDAGNPIRVRINLTALTTTYKAVGAMTTELLSSTTPYFRTPTVMPATSRIRIRLSTALTNAVSVFVDHPALTAATRLYTGGPYAAVFSGSVNFAANKDTATIVIANNFGSGWQKLLERFWNLRQLGLQIPSSAAPTIADSLIG